MTTASDGGPGSLRQTIADADAGDSLSFDASLDGQVILLGGTQLTVDKSLTIDASGLPAGLTLDAGGLSRVIEVPFGLAEVTLDSLTLTGGRTSGNGDGGAVRNGGEVLAMIDCVLVDNGTGDGFSHDGGAVANRFGKTLEVTRCEFRDNFTGDGVDGGFFPGNAGGYGGAIENQGTLVAEDCRFIGNRTGIGAVEDGQTGRGGGWGGAIANSEGGSATLRNSLFQGNGTGEGNPGAEAGVRGGFGGRGGAIYNDEAMVIEECRILDNRTGGGGRGEGANDGGGGGDGGGIFNAGELTVSDTDVSGNLTGDGGIGNTSGRGGGLASYGTGSSCEIERCAITRNRTGEASDGGPRGSGGGIYAQGLTLSDATLSHNECGESGGGLFAYGGPNTLTRCTIVDNLARTGSGGGVIDSSILIVIDSVLANNRAGNSGQDFSAAGSFVEGGANLIEQITGEEPLLAPLGHYGGPTPTRPPLPGSPVIDASPSANPGGTDQRGLPRFVNGAVDLGAFERQGVEDELRVIGADVDGDGTCFWAEQALGTDPEVPDPGDSRNLSAPEFGPLGAALEFGRSPAAFPTTVWTLKRATDLAGPYEVIYLFDGVTESFDPSRFSSEMGPDEIRVFDRTPPSPRAFYVFEAEIE